MVQKILFIALLEKATCYFFTCSYHHSGGRTSFCKIRKIPRFKVTASWNFKNWKFCWNNTVRRRKSTSNLVGFTEHCRVLSDLLTTLKGENESIDSLIDLIYFIYFLELCNQHQLLNSPQSKAHESRFPPAVESRSQDTLPWFGLDWLLCLAK